MPHEPCTTTLHGHDLCYLDAGHGPGIVVIHGLLGSHHDWVHLVDRLSARHRLVAPDLFGHGTSAKTVGDYSLGAHAGALRDLLDLLGMPSVTLVGHSLGGGIAMQFAYLFPERVERLVLVSSGGLGRELSPLLRAPTVPGAEWLLPLVASAWVRNSGDAVGRVLGRIGLKAGADARQAWHGFLQLGDADSRRAFLSTARSVIDPGGQSVSALNRLATITVPTMLVWGGRDRMIPAHHAMTATEHLPDSRVEIFERAGHFPHLDEPERFAALLTDFIDDGDRSTDPATSPSADPGRRPSPTGGAARQRR